MDDKFVELHVTSGKRCIIGSEGTIQIPSEYLSDLGLELGDYVSIRNAIIDGERSLIIKKKKKHFIDIDNLDSLELCGSLFKVGENVKITYNNPRDEEYEYVGKIESILKTKWEIDASISCCVILNTTDKRLLIERIKEIERI